MCLLLTGVGPPPVGVNTKGSLTLSVVSYSIDIHVRLTEPAQERASQSLRGIMTPQQIAIKIHYNEKRRLEVQKKRQRKLHSRKSWLQRKYNLTLEDYERLKTEQGGCGICGKVYKQKNYCVDHDHSTGKVRGLLCTNCNRSLGVFGDNVAGILKVLQYLQG